MIEEERERFARELHDESGSLLTALKISLGHLAAASATMRRRTRATRQCLELVEAAAQARPAHRACIAPAGARLRHRRDRALAGAEFEKNTGIRCKVTSNVAECDPGRAQTTALFRILQEALTNIAKHAGRDTKWTSSCSPTAAR